MRNWFYIHPFTHSLLCLPSGAARCFVVNIDRTPLAQGVPASVKNRLASFSPWKRTTSSLWKTPSGGGDAGSGKTNTLRVLEILLPSFRYLTLTMTFVVLECISRQCI